MVVGSAVRGRHHVRRTLPDWFWPLWWFVMGALMMAGTDAVYLLARC